MSRDDMINDALQKYIADMKEAQSRIEEIDNEYVAKIKEIENAE